MTKITVNFLGKYVLSDPYVVVQMACTVGMHCATLALPCVLAEQVYHYIKVTKNILP